MMKKDKKRKMLHLYGLIVIGIFLSSCASIPLEYVEPAEPLQKGYTRYTCTSVGKNADYYHKDQAYWFEDINIKRGVVIVQYASKYTGKSKESPWRYEIINSDNKKIVYGDANYTRTFFYGSTENLVSSTGGRTFANCTKIEGPDIKIVKEPKPTPDDDKIVAASMGSGFFVTREGHLVTNFHVIEECNAVKTNILGKEIRTDIVAIDKTNDLAIIKAEMNPSKVFPVSNEDVSLMQDVIVAGFPLGKKVSSAIKIHKGSVTALAGFGDNYSNFQTDATINQGNSGGPIMNKKGNVVGVAVQLIAAEHAQNVFFGVKSSTLKTFANANNIKFLTPNHQELSNEDLGKLITEATVYLECWMTVAKIKQIIAQEENRKAFYSEHK